MAGEGEQGFPDAVLRYVVRFDRGEYWLAHEELEELWQEDRRDPFKGFIQIAAAFVHLERENWRGARRLLTTALEYLRTAPEHFEGFDVVAVRERTSRLLGQVSSLAQGEDAGSRETATFSMSPLFAGDVADLNVDDVELPYRVRRYAEGYRPGAASGVSRTRPRTRAGDEDR